MTSKRKLRAEIERLTYLDRLSSDWLDGFEVAAAIDLGNTRPWAAHLARVTDAAREQGKREGWTAAWAAGARADEDAYRRGWEDAVADATLAAGDDATPEHDEPSAGEFAGMAFPPLPRGLDSPTPGYYPYACGFACRCATIPSPWTPGSVTR